MIPSPYHLGDGGKLIEVGVVPAFVADGDLFAVVAWRCAKCKQVIYSDDDTDEYGFR